ncbi:hypothetical protein [Mesorhizobium muleiense]|uniref:hypothetical protein n=1 Tax=Mesorhizobium muleiense TaxID=1004279 RepID=UPI001F1980F4|nr:hypothetical protein [Mesorhizobium muleiense]MCF6112394.1 hypothetical protein [Mesorhizobium muleiense]
MDWLTIPEAILRANARGVVLSGVEVQAAAQRHAFETRGSVTSKRGRFGNDMPIMNEMHPGYLDYWYGDFEVGCAAFDQWLDGVVGPAKLPGNDNAPAHRHKGTGMATTDAPYVEMMQDLLIRKQANSRSDAAKKVIAQNPELAPLTTDQDSVVRRLRDRHRLTYGE